jgi:hypothetical protein
MIPRRFLSDSSKRSRLSSTTFQRERKTKRLKRSLIAVIGDLPKLKNTVNRFGALVLSETHPEPYGTDAALSAK